MEKLSIIGVFCEDIREEVGGTTTLIGLLSDTVNVNAATRGAAEKTESKFLGKLCVFVRANFDPDNPIRIKTYLVFPDGQELEVGSAEGDIIGKAQSDAKNKGNPLAGIVLKAILGGFSLSSDGGVVRLEADINGERRLLGAINFVVT